MRLRVRKRQGFAALRRLVDQLNEIADGAAAREAVDKFANYLNGRLNAEIARHFYSGKMADTLAIKVVGGKRIEIDLMSYRRYIPRFAWAKGFPNTALKRGQAILKEALAKRLAA